MWSLYSDNTAGEEVTVLLVIRVHLEVLPQAGHLACLGVVIVRPATTETSYLPIVVRVIVLRLGRDFSEDEEEWMDDLVRFCYVEVPRGDRFCPCTRHCPVFVR